jgi:hypothetical protein
MRWVHFTEFTRRYVEHVSCCHYFVYAERKEKKNYARTWYWHECEPVVQMLNTAGHVVA